MSHTVLSGLGLRPCTMHQTQQHWVSCVPICCSWYGLLAMCSKVQCTFSNLEAFLSVARTRASSERCFRPLVGVVLLFVCYQVEGRGISLDVAYLKMNWWSSVAASPPCA
jgi:hypothetical protein